MDFFFNLPIWLQTAIKGIAAIAMLIPFAGACSMAERKVSAWIQGRPGPNRAIVPWVAWIPFLGRFLQRLGVFHLMADGGKFVFKENVVPAHVNRFYYQLAPVIALIPALTTIVFVPFGVYWDAKHTLQPLVLANLDVGILAVFAVSSLGVYSIILAGWASNSKYPFLGSVRASAQLISYELSMTLSVLPVFLWANQPGGNGTLSLFDVVQLQSGHGFHWQSIWYVILMPLSAFIFLVSLFAETNRQPFDMPESEADLVGGFHTEYGEFKWSLFFVAEYAHMIVGSGVFVLLFLGGWNPLPGLPLAPLIAGLPVWLGGLIAMAIFIGKVIAFIFLFMWVRWTLPRFRYDQVMKIGWQKLLPLAIANLIFYAIAIAIIQK
ncbi:MAG TPA: complex I subunit 1 family protein [Opitutaceae bacterium]|nr:complex I subunit 1 family protein [Opitutaceae bacterium]